MIIKHVTSKSSSYAATQEYMEHEHDEHGKELKDEQGQPVERYYLCDTLNVQSKETWANECKYANNYYGQNQKKGDIKQHQYIISFSPEESQQLTPQEVMQIGKEWTQENLPGHQAILYVHTDGHNYSGNYHVHVNINSVRVEDVPQQDWMNGQRKHYCEGMKHTQTAKELYSMRESLNQLAERHNLNMRLQERTGRKLDDKEYYADRRGKAKQGSDFDTQKEELRQCIRATVPQCMENGQLNNAKYIEEMQRQWGVTVTESRGRYSYMHPEWQRKKPVSDRKLGEDYRKENIQHGFTEQINRSDSKRAVDTAELVRGARAQRDRAGADADYRAARNAAAISNRAGRELEQQRQRAEKSARAEQKERTNQAESRRRTRGLHL